jgi:hypothetical protein
MSIRTAARRLAEVSALAFLVTLGAGLAVLYLSLPVFVAQMQRQLHPIAIGIGIFVFCLVWWLVAIFAVDAAASIYGFRRPFAYERFGLRIGPPMLLTPAAAILRVLSSYALTLYAFAVIYTAISVGNPAAFNQPLSFGAAIYFSVVTAATVGYGDIIPISPWARFAVVAEIITSFMYITGLFSVVAGLAWQKRKAD